MEKVREEGFLVVERKTMKFTRRLAERFYEQHRNKACHRKSDHENVQGMATCFWLNGITSYLY